MNIFELIVSDPSNYQQVTSDFTNHNQNWTLFKQNLQALFHSSLNDVDTFLMRSK